MVRGRLKKPKDLLIRTGISLFGASTAEAVSTDEIIRAGGVSKQTFYNHFKDKSALTREVLRVVRQDYEASCARINRDERDSARRVARALCVYARLAVDNKQRGRVLARMLIEDLAFDNDTNQGVISDVSSGLADGRLGVLSLETGVAFIFGVTQALVARVLTCNDVTTAVAVSQQFGTLLLRAFGISATESEMIAAQAADKIVRTGLDSEHL